MEGEHDGALSLHLAATGGGAFHMGYFPRDWSGYRLLSLRIRSGAVGIPLACRINDRAHDLAVPHVDSDHYEELFELSEGWQEIRIDLGKAAASLPTRRMDLDEMNSLTCLSPGAGREVELALDRVELTG